jgi:uncharacterized protein (TIGR02996 family)
VTSERDFYAAMDAEPENIDIRGIFADWLDERNDPLAAGWRALWVGGYTAWWLRGSKCWAFYSDDSPDINIGSSARFIIPASWHWLVVTTRHVRRTIPDRGLIYTPEDNPRYGPRVLLKALAVAFTKLPAERQAELLRPVPSTANA